MKVKGNRPYSMFKGYGMNNYYARLNIHIYHSRKEKDINSRVDVKLWQRDAEREQDNMDKNAWLMVSAISLGVCLVP